MAAASGLSVKVPGPSGLRVASTSSSLGCHGTLIKKTDKLTLRQDINVKVLHAVMALIDEQGHK
jgi:hypothetical protein